MKFSFRFFSFILAICLLFLTAGCTQNESPETIPAPTEDARTVYHQAVAALSAAGSYQMEITLTKTSELDGSVYREKHYQTRSCTGYGTEDVQFYLEEAIEYSNYSIEIQEGFRDGIAYCTIAGNSFTAECTAEDYFASLIPTTVLDETIYRKVESRTHGSITSIGFSEPLAGETWAIPTDAKLIDAVGLIRLNSHERPSKCFYELTYSLPSGNISVSVEAEITYPETLQISIPASLQSSVLIQDIRVPRYLEQACGMLLETQSLQADSHQTILCQTGNLQRIQSTSLSMLGSGDDWTASVRTDVQLQDLSSGESSTYHQSEDFSNGRYRSTGSESNVEEDISREMMQDYCQELLISNIVLPEYIADASCSLTGGALLLEITATEALGQIICDNACETLYGDSGALQTLSSASRIDSASCTISLDEDTGRPISTGMECTAVYTIDGNEYTLRFQFLQDFIFAQN